MLPEILDPKLAQGLLDMSRQSYKNRYKNDLFSINLKRKLRLDLWHEPGVHKCPLCGKEMDNKGDHLFRCRNISKTAMHNKWKLGLNQLLQEILPLVKLIRSPTTVRDEQRGLVRKLKNTKVCPGDISFRIDHYLDETYWRTPLQRILI